MFEFEPNVRDIHDRSAAFTYNELRQRVAWNGNGCNFVVLPISILVNPPLVYTNNGHYGTYTNADTNKNFP